MILSTLINSSFNTVINTRMHSSRMRTASSSSRLLGKGGVSLSACWDTHHPWGEPGDPPRCGPGDPSGQTPQPHPLGVGLETPPARPLNFPPSVGQETLPGHTPQPPSWVWAWRPARHAGIPPPAPPPVDRILDTRF